MRLDFFISNSTGLSRKDAKRAIGKGQVELNHQLCRDPSTKVSETDAIILNGEPVSLRGELYLMLNKPEGVVSATTDSQHPTALDLIPANMRRALHIAGRLDLDTTGLLLLTTDGQWSHKVTSPKSRCDKTYRVELDQAIDEDAIKALKTGVILKDDTTPTRPAGVQVISDREIELTISEGRYHQVKRMLAAVGNHVVRLHRLKVGAVELDQALAPGDYRELTQEEVLSLG